MLIILGLGDKTVQIWGMNLCNLKVLSINDDPNVDMGMTSMAISPDACFVAAGLLNTVMRTWDVVTGTHLDHPCRHSNLVYSVVFMPASKGLVSSLLNKMLKYLELNMAVNSTCKAGCCSLA